MYLKADDDNNSIASLKYGRQHEQDAVDSYIAYKSLAGNTGLRVWEVGTVLSKSLVRNSTSPKLRYKSDLSIWGNAN